MYALTPHFHLPKVPLLPRTCRATATSPARTPTANLPRRFPTTTTTTTPGPVNDSSLRSTWAHRAWVAAGFASVLTSLAKSVSAAVDSGLALEPLLAAFLGYVLADLGTGIYHWAIDNYGGPSTPIFGPQIEAFRGHHRWPRTITRRDFANNLNALARAVTSAVLPIEFLASDDAAVHAFVGACAGCVMMSQQFHAWAHETKRGLPPVVVALQDAGVLVSRAEHAAHHRPPYNTNYCIVSGVWNGLLDEWKVFEAMEMVVFFRFGVRPRSWGEPELEWREDDGGASSESTGC